MLITFGGLPGTGKSTLARRLAIRLSATYLRIDTIEQSLRDCATLPNGVVTEGYAVGYRVAEDNLVLGRVVIADSVNPLAITRDAWQDVARRADVRLVEIEVVCSDPTQHRRRVESRASDIPGLKLPNWDSVQNRHYEPWGRPRIVLDTASQSVEACEAALLSALH